MIKGIIRKLYIRFIDEPYFPHYKTVDFEGSINADMVCHPPWGVTTNGIKLQGNPVLVLRHVKGSKYYKEFWKTL